MTRRSLLAAGAVLVALLLLVLWLRGGQGGGAQSIPSPNGPSATGPSATGSSAPGPSASSGASSTASPGALASCGDVPEEVDAAVAAVRADGPYLRPKDDGGTFGNRERLLPPKPRGYYREYTVRAPGQRFPGPRRLVTGGQQRLGDNPQVWYYTADHYQSYCQLYPTGGRAR